MARFSEAWLKEYVSRRAQTLPPLDPAPILLTLKRPTITLNELLRLHWSTRGKLAKSISAELAKQLPAKQLGRAPFERALVTITRYSVGVCDEDNLRGTKILTDCLLPFSKTHPNGLGLVRDDSPQHMTQRIVPVVVATMAEQRTEIRIEPIAS